MKYDILPSVSYISNTNISLHIMHSDEYFLSKSRKLDEICLYRESYVPPEDDHIGIETRFGLFNVLFQNLILSSLLHQKFQVTYGEILPYVTL